MAACRVLGKHGSNALRTGYSSLHTDTARTPASSSLYPPIVASLTAKSKASSRRRMEEFYNRAHAASSVEEKLKIITGLQRLKYVVCPQTFALNADRWYQDFTKTAFLPGLPHKRHGDTGGVDALTSEDLADVKSLVCEALLQELFYHKKGRTFMSRFQEHSSAPFLSNLMSILSSQCAKHNPLLAQSCLDSKPQVNFYWLRGETTVPRGHRRGRVDPVRFQIDDQPFLQIRVPKQLPEFLPLDEIVPDEIPRIPYEPNRLPLFRRQYENKVFIGSKIKDPCKFGHTQVHLVPDRFTRDRLTKINLADQIEVFLRANAITSLFAWTGAQAMYQGFWSQADVTRPFVSQGIISDGKYFSFFCYQLNTLALAVDSDRNNPRKNICWGTSSTPLYEAVEDDQIHGFNNDVLKQIIAFLLNRPELI